MGIKSDRLTAFIAVTMLFQENIRVVLLTFLLILNVNADHADRENKVDIEDSLHAYIRAELKPLEDSLGCIQNSILNIQRQLMDNQLTIEEKARTDGMSGIKQSRAEFGGTKPYYRESYKGKRIATMHNHANFERTLGMGEFVAVLNGVQFTTRHNDYDLREVQFGNRTFLATEDIPFPDVPPSVLAEKTINGQIKEMREYFRAWKNSDTSIRNYKPYFQAILVYLEGWWSADNHTMVDFKSARHKYDGKTWGDMWQKYRFTAEAGRKNAKENIAYLPTKLYNPHSCSDPAEMSSCDVQVAQWTYRLVGKKLPGNLNLDLNRFRIVHDDMATMLTRLKKLDEDKLYKHSATRFQINPDNQPWEKVPEERPTPYFDTLDKMFASIPGLDNEGNSKDSAFNIDTFRANGGQNMKLNGARYHRKYVENDAGAMGSADRFRFFSDDQLFMAMNRQTKVAKVCLNNSCRDCEEKCVCQRWSYAFPLEIVYMTPLSKWNPYNLEFHTQNGEHVKTGIPGAKNKFGKARNGDLTNVHLAYDGTDIEHYFRTPSEFYTGTGEDEDDPADTSSKLAVGVLDRSGKIRSVAPSGHFRMMPEIPGVGLIRQRYPIVPVHVEGGGLGKELRALQDIVLDWKTNRNLYRDDLTCPV